LAQWADDLFRKWQGISRAWCGASAFVAGARVAFVAFDRHRLAIQEEPSHLSTRLERWQGLGAFGVRVLLCLRLGGSLNHGNTLTLGRGNSGVVWLQFGCVNGNVRGWHRENGTPIAPNSPDGMGVLDKI
jgi:hypothetical protein